MERKGLMKNLLKMPKSKLDELLSKVNVKDMVAQEKYGELLATMQADYGLLGDVEDDKETAKLMDIWSTSDVTQADEVYQSWDKEKAANEKELELE
jgi:hypothetical protein